MLQRFSACAFCLLLIFTIGAPAQTVERHEYAFQISANGFRYGDFLIELAEDPKSYNVRVSAEAKGILGLLLRAKYSGESNGKRRPNGTRQGLHFMARSSRIFTDRTQQVTYRNGHPETVIIPQHFLKTIRARHRAKSARQSERYNLVFANPDMWNLTD